MGYSFTQIEKTKSQTIKLAFGFLCLLYFLTAWVLVFAFKNYGNFEKFYEYGYLRLSHFTVVEHLVIVILACSVAGMHWFFITNDLSGRIRGLLRAKETNPTDPRHQLFCNVIQEVSVATGGTEIKGMIIPTMALNACSFADGQSIPVIAVTEGLLHKLTRAQLEAVVGHEAAHIVSGDCQEATVISSMFEISAGKLRGLRPDWRSSDEDSQWSSSPRIRWGGSGGSGGGRGGNGSAFFLIFILCIILFLALVSFFAALMRMFISRQREFRADAVATRLTRDPLALAESLYLISNRRHSVLDSGDGMESMFMVNTLDSHWDEQQGFLPDLFSTHPPVGQRIKILMSMAHASEEDLQTADAVLAAQEQKENEIQKQKENELGQASAKRAESPEICPACRSALTQVQYERVDVFKCPNCLGFLIGPDDLSVILSRKEIQFDERIKKMAETLLNEPRSTPLDNLVFQKSERDYRCDQCWNYPAKWNKCLFNSFYHIEVDKCLACGKVWFDKDELEVMQCIYEMRDQAGRSAG